MRDLLEALKTLDRYGLLQSKRARSTGRQEIVDEIRKGGVRKPMTDAQRNAVIRLRGKRTGPEAAKLLGVHTSTVYRLWGSVNGTKRKTAKKRRGRARAGVHRARAGRTR